MFHVELRQFPHQTRAFNLTREELDARILRPWVSGERVEVNDRRWAPDRATLAIYEGPILGVNEMGMGRGWQNVTRRGKDVTEQLLTESRAVGSDVPTAEDFRAEIAGRAGAGAIPISGLVEIAGEWYPQSRVSERIALCERVVWELLHSVPVELSRGDEQVPAYEWQHVLLTWATWIDDGPDAVTLGPV